MLISICSKDYPQRCISVVRPNRPTPRRDAAAAAIRIFSPPVIPSGFCVRALGGGWRETQIDPARDTEESNFHSGPPEKRRE